MATLFFSYAHADEALRDQLEKHLSALRHQGLIETWHDRRIVVGQVIDDEIDARLEAADIILLLVSSDFLSSEYCYKREMKRAIERHERGEAITIPVILRPCDWHDTPFGGLLAAPKDGLPVTKWANTDEAFLDIVSAIKKAVRARGSEPQVERWESPTEVRPTSKPVIRSSNLRVRKEFSDYDKDSFQREGFDYIANFFENSLTELVERNPGLNKEFRRVDANRFTAAVYEQGKKVCRGSIHMGGMMGGIAYSHDENAAMNSLNESLSVEADEQSLHFKLLGMSRFGSEEPRLSFEGAAEAYWSLFLEPLQRRR